MILDASVLIAHADAEDSHHAEAVTLLLDAATDSFGVDPLTLAEFYVGPARAGRLPDAERYTARLGIEVVALPADAPQRLAHLRAETGLRLPDCCVLLTALQTGDPMATLDRSLRESAAALGIALR